MTAIIFILIGAFITYLVMSSMQKSAETNDIVERLDTENTFIHYKKKIIATSAYDQERVYELLYHKVHSLTCELIEKHSSILLPPLIWENINQGFRNYFEQGGDAYCIRRDLSFYQEPNHYLLALAIICFYGTKRHDGILIESNRDFANKAIEYLIEVDHYWPAKLAKALIIKYGFQPYIPPNTETSSRLFHEIEKDYPLAHDELENMDQLRQLENITSVHPGKGYHGDWRSHAVFVQIDNYVRSKKG